jgi:hypothetical protein
MAGIGDYEKGKAFELRSGKKPAFKMLGSSPMKQDVNIQTGFGPEADANLKRKINVKPNKPVIPKKAKKSLVKTVLRGGGKILGKLAWPLVALDAAMNVSKLKEKQGVKKFVGSMIWDEDLFTKSVHEHLNPPKITKYNPNKETTPKPKKIDWKNTKSSL